MQQLTEGADFNTVVGDFMSLNDVTVWVRANFSSDAPKSEYFIDLDILLAGIRYTGVRSEDFQNKEFHAYIVKCLANKSVAVKSFQRNSPEDWGSSNENNHFSKMKFFEQWNCGDGKRGIMPSIKKGIISYEKAAHSSFNYAFPPIAQKSSLCMVWKCIIE